MRFVVSACVTSRRHRKVIYTYTCFAKHPAVLEVFIFTTTALDHMHPPNFASLTDPQLRKN